MRWERRPGNSTWLTLHAYNESAWGVQGGRADGAGGSWPALPCPLRGRGPRATERSIVTSITTGGYRLSTVSLARQNAHERGAPARRLEAEADAIPAGLNALFAYVAGLKFGFAAKIRAWR